MIPTMKTTSPISQCCLHDHPPPGRRITPSAKSKSNVPITEIRSDFRQPILLLKKNIGWPRGRCGTPIVTSRD